MGTPQALTQELRSGYDNEIQPVTKFKTLYF